jgi:hypothetical protein
MRLTLRTLLAYLDDTLEPSQARQIGQKVTESDTAQELIARIKQVTRRRRLTTPPETGPNKLDPNAIAEYLDNTLSPDQLADVEQICLASDVHLAEMAACHQILTLVLGEPALVPPTAKQRMYALVKGREAIPFRKPPAAEGGDAEEPGPEGKEVDETLRLGLPALRRKEGWRNPLIILGGALGLVACLIIAIINLLPSTHKGEQTGPGKAEERQAQANLKADADKKNKPAPPTDDRDKKKKSDDGKQVEGKGKQDGGPKGDGKQEGGDKGAAKQDQAAKDTGTPKVKAVEAPKSTEVPVGPPSTREVDAGRYVAPKLPETTVLLQYDPAKSEWRRFEPQIKMPVLTARPLVSLPGFRSVIQTDKGVRLTLAGTMPEFFPGPPFLFESLVVLHDHKDLDLDLTLLRGRIFLTNTLSDRPVRVRVRFENTTDAASKEMWDITLEGKDAEVLIDGFGLYQPPGQPFYVNPKDPNRQGPLKQMGLIVRHGPVHLHADSEGYALKPPPGPALVGWNSHKGLKRPEKLEELFPWARPEPLMPKGLPKEVEDQYFAMKGAITELSKDLLGRPVDVGLKRALTAPGSTAAQRRLTVRCFGALDMLPQMVEALSDKRTDVRKAAIETLMHWLAASRDNDYKLFAELKERYKGIECENIISMLHGPLAGPKSDPQVFDGLIDLLVDAPLALRELAAWQLYAAFPRAYEEIRYDATAPREIRQRVQKQWRSYVRQGGKAPGGKGPK